MQFCILTGYGDAQSGGLSCFLDVLTICGALHGWQQGCINACCSLFS